MQVINLQEVELINLNLQSYLLTRKRACEQINKMFGLNVTVSETQDEFQQEVMDDGELYNDNSGDVE